MMKMNFFLGLILFCVSCSNPTHTTDCDKMTHQIISEYIAKMKKKDLRVIGIGGGKKEGKKNLFEVTFTINQKLDINLARKLAVEAVDEFLYLINLKENYKDCLVEYPFPSSKIKIIIIGQELGAEDTNRIVGVLASLGTLDYCIHDPEDNIRLKTIHVETFEEAKRIVYQK